ncbi:MAG: uracil-DNA glycosylase [Oscillospiraceae bacterium]|nr:uracil-DNA glycosylase [Oscillospiraceae bacterium]
MTKTEQLAVIYQTKCRDCRRCALAQYRHNLVFGDGNPDRQIMLIGEGPGEQEDLTGIPFVGKAGQLLDQMLDIINLTREDYYICNIVKCRPPQNRDPQTVEQDACIHWLNQQIRVVEPKIVVCLGRIAACRIIRDNYRITREHGRWEQRNGVWLTAIYHPSALLRDVSKRPETFDDLKSIQQKIWEVFPERQSEPW